MSQTLITSYNKCNFSGAAAACCTGEARADREAEREACDMRPRKERFSLKTPEKS
jgi:hypothetical protein